MKAEQNLVLGGRYRLIDLLATGGMGEVWSATDQSVGRTVAVKVLREEYTGHQEFLRRLRTEARNSAALAHPNIAQMFDYGEEAGTGYLVMELVPGESLADLLDRQPILPSKILIPILADTARGLQHAHHNSVVHRDVKPGNILLQEVLPGTAPKVKITDFGVSLAANQAPMTATGMVMGTAQYLSPEQAVGNPATARSDLYALGVIAYEASVGKRPFTGKSPVDIAIAHVNDPVPPLPATVEPRLAAIIMRLLAKDPDQRHESAAVLAAELDALVTPPPPKYSHVASTPIPVVTPATGAAIAEAAGAAGGLPDDAVPRYTSRAARRSGAMPGSATAPPAPNHHQPEPPSPLQPNIGERPGGHNAGYLNSGAAPLPVRTSIRRPVNPVMAGHIDVPPPPRVGSHSHFGSHSYPGAASSGVNGRVAPNNQMNTGNTSTRRDNARNERQRAARPAPPHQEPWDEPTDRKPPPRLAIAAVVLALIVILYLIVRHFADAAEPLSGQIYLNAGTIVLASFPELGRHLGG